MIESEKKRKIVRQHLEATKSDGADAWEIQTPSCEKPESVQQKEKGRS